MTESNASTQALELMEQGWADRRAGRTTEAHDKLVEAILISRKAGAQGTLAKALRRFGQLQHDFDKLEETFRYYEEAVTVSRTVDDPIELAESVRHLGDSHRELGRTALAESCFNEALALVRNHKPTSILTLANVLIRMADLKENAGLLDEAKMLWEEARDLYGQIGVGEGVEGCSSRIAKLEGGSIR